MFSLYRNPDLDDRIYDCLLTWLDTLSGRIGKVVASHAAMARSSPAEVALVYTMHEALRGCDQSIGSTISDAIVRSWLWLTSTRSLLGCFGTLLQAVDISTHILW